MTDRSTNDHEQAKATNRYEAEVRSLEIGQEDVRLLQDEAGCPRCGDVWDLGRAVLHRLAVLLCDFRVGGPEAARKTCEDTIIPLLQACAKSDWFQLVEKTPERLPSELNMGRIQRKAARQEAARRLLNVCHRREEDLNRAVIDSIVDVVLLFQVTGNADAARQKCEVELIPLLEAATARRAGETATSAGAGDRGH